MDRTEQQDLYGTAGVAAPPSTINLYPNTIRLGTRKCECGAQLFFARTVANGRMMPFTANPRDFIVRTGEDGTIYVDRKICHFLDCPNADAHRKTKAR